MSYSHSRDHSIFIRNKHKEKAQRVAKHRINFLMEASADHPSSKNGQCENNDEILIYPKESYVVNPHSQKRSHFQSFVRMR